MKSISVILLTLFVSSSSFAFQGRKEVKLSEIYRDLIQSDELDLYYENIKIVNDFFSIQYDDAFTSNYIDTLEQVLNIKIKTDSSGIITPVKSIFFNDVHADYLTLGQFKIDLLRFYDVETDYLTLDKLGLNTLQIDSVIVRDMYRLDSSSVDNYADSRNTYHGVKLFNNSFKNHFMITQTHVDQLMWVFDNIFQEGAYIEPEFQGNFSDFSMENCIFEPIDSDIPVNIEEFEYEPMVFKTQVYLNLFGIIYQTNLANNQFLKDKDDQFVLLQGESNFLGIESNHFESHFFPQYTVNKQFTLSENSFEDKVIFSELILEGQNNYIDWQSITGFKMAVGLILEYTLVDEIGRRDIPEELSQPLFKQTGNIIAEVYEGNKEEDYEEIDSFQSLISSYYRLYTNIKSNGQIENSNLVYIEMKDVQLKQFSYLYNTYGTLDYWVKWRLGQLLKIYTDHGTNPAKAIRISIWVVLLFSIFYFFFPSEWDTKSKGMMIDDYKSFVEKNEKGYFIPFMRLSFGFGKSLFNAMTLSLNSFVTLGFGSIPTSGLARYVCILQGFIGWFLLSIFTASLINQVLF